MKSIKTKLIAFNLWLFFHTCISSPSPPSALTKRHLLLSLPLQPAWLYKAGSSSRGLLYVSDGYGERRHGRGRRSPEYYEESEPEELTRVFVALFDYDPLSMSPNPDAADEELPFKEGQVIKVVDCNSHTLNQKCCFPIWRLFLRVKALSCLNAEICFYGTEPVFDPCNICI